MNKLKEQKQIPKTKINMFKLSVVIFVHLFLIPIVFLIR